MDSERDDGVVAPARLVDRVAAASVGRDRVLDAVKVVALLLVIVGHSLAWHVAGGEAGNVLEVRPQVAGLTWAFQILGLFFAAGAVTNAASLARCGDPAQWLGHRMERLLGPVLVYCLVFAAVLLPLSLVFGQPVEDAGRFLAQLTWFVGIYLVVVAAVPWTSQHRSPVLLAGWLMLILAVDVIRLNLWPAVGWVNMVLVWGWLHQVGYWWPDLRQRPKPRLMLGAAASMGAALLLAYLGPYSNSMVSFGGDPEPSNLSPPTVVAALHGLALILIVAAAWSLLERVLAAPRLWTAVALLGSSGMGLYLWHIPVVGLVAGSFMLAGSSPPPFGLGWWAVHLGTVVVAVAGAWLLAGAAAGPERRLRRIAGARTQTTGVAMVLMCLAGAAILLLSVTGLGTWWSTSFLGVPASAPVLLAALLVLWKMRYVPDRRAEAAGSVAG